MPDYSLSTAALPAPPIGEAQKALRDLSRPTFILTASTATDPTAPGAERAPELQPPPGVKEVSERLWSDARIKNIRTEKNLPPDVINSLSQIIAYTAALEKREPTDRFIARRIDSMLNELCQGTNPAELEQKVVRLALEYAQQLDNERRQAQEAAKKAQEEAAKKAATARANDSAPQPPKEAASQAEEQKGAAPKSTNPANDPTPTSRDVSTAPDEMQEVPEDYFQELEEEDVSTAPDEMPQAPEDYLQEPEEEEDSPAQAPQKKEPDVEEQQNPSESQDSEIVAQKADGTIKTLQSLCNAKTTGWDIMDVLEHCSKAEIEEVKKRWNGAISLEKTIATYVTNRDAKCAIEARLSGDTKAIAAAVEQVLAPPVVEANPRPSYNIGPSYASIPGPNKPAPTSSQRKIEMLLTGLTDEEKAAVINTKKPEQWREILERSGQCGETLLEIAEKLAPSEVQKLWKQIGMGLSIVKTAEVGSRVFGEQFRTSMEEAVRLEKAGAPWRWFTNGRGGNDKEAFKELLAPKRSKEELKNLERAFLMLYRDKHPEWTSLRAYVESEFGADLDLEEYKPIREALNAIDSTD
jgi:hypothetical protein